MLGSGIGHHGMIHPELSHGVGLMQFCAGISVFRRLASGSDVRLAKQSVVATGRTALADHCLRGAGARAEHAAARRLPNGV